MNTPAAGSRNTKPYGVVIRRGVLAGGMAAILLVGGFAAAPASYAAPTDSKTISVSGNVNGHEFKAYKLGVFGNVTIDGTAAEATVTSVDDATRRKIQAAASEAGISIVAGQDPIDAVARADAAKVHAFVAALTKTSLTPTATATGKDGKAELDVTEGWYLVTDSMGLPILVGTTITSGGKTASTLGSTPLGQVEVKNTHVTVDKKVNGQEEDSVSVGSTVTYTVDVTLPAKAHLKSYSFSDRLTGGTYEGTVTGEVDGSTVSLTPKFDSKKESFTIDLTGVLKDDEKTLTLTYKAVTTAETTTNDAKAEGVDRYGATLTPGEDTVTVQAYDFSLSKVSSLNANERLDGAKFKIRETDGKWLKYDQSSGKWSAASSESDASTFTPGGTAGDGAIVFPGLGAGSYTVKETQAPDGYTLNGGVQFQAVIGDDGGVTFSGQASAASGDAGTAVVKNMPTLDELARTGVDVGTGGLIAGGLAAVCASIAGAVALTARRREMKA